MSLVLNDGSSEGISIKTLGTTVPGLIMSVKDNDYVHISDKDMSTMIKYYMTNTDLNYVDARPKLVQWFKDLEVGKGYNDGKSRYVGK